VHQGNAYFEHCYAADRDERVSTAQREACWSAWIAHYTRFQAPHRVDYALRRLESLQMGDMMDPEPIESPQAPAEDPVQSPNSLQTYASQGVDTKRGCAVTCQQLGAECQHHCDARGDHCVKTCEAEERVCVGGCY